MANRVLIGLYQANDWRLRISAPGFNVLGSLSKNQLYFDSAWPKALNVFLKGSFSFPRQNGGTTYSAVSWPDLGYVPPALTYALGFNGAASHPMHVVAPIIKSNGIDLFFEQTYQQNEGLFTVYYIVLRGAEGQS
jgi:hypothetical protein